MKPVKWMVLRSAWVTLALMACTAEPPAPATSVHVELRGGPNPGVYEASTPAPACTRDVMGKGSWGVQLNDWSGPESGLRSLQLVVPASAATANTGFYLGMVFGDVFAGAVHEIETRAEAPRSKGNGQVQIQEMEGGGALVVTGVTGDSVMVSMTIQCHRMNENNANHRRGARRA